ncbi:leucyl/phenylalanyl-tRNA--protein transferase [Maribacter algicola]|uniref:Leucyl/phenylalanyl-tRNA--protein transferase n=1 Tax=Maribacter algicola TaxID=2498892 RepID=A0A426RPF6_9FLAO|nr:leucyl/phenylalanyl-tRNA--protein transferase [Maribacter algicola]RRQ50863.1 leucyl/phenylalanyl-tRNA--protein transferase [Maribacter algicola]
MYFLDQELYFPPVERANSEGLLAVGGDLSPERLLLAYRSGIFPWFNDDSLILWWSPDPRMVLYPEEICISKSMRKVIKSDKFSVTVNTCFESVVENCSAIKRDGQKGTWITQEMKSAYIKLHEIGIAKSYEVWEEGSLVGGLYGVDLGHVFCGESMFSKKSNTSKLAFIRLAHDLLEKGYRFVDCQLYTDHLSSLGAREISRESFMEQLKA